VATRRNEGAWNDSEEAKLSGVFFVTTPSQYFYVLFTKM